MREGGPELNDSFELCSYHSPASCIILDKSLNSVHVSICKMGKIMNIYIKKIQNTAWFVISMFQTNFLLLVHVFSLT